MFLNLKKTTEDNKINRAEVRSICEKAGIKIEKCFNIAARNKTSDNHWADVNPLNFEKPWTFVLVDQYNSKLHVLQIPPRAINPNLFRIKAGKLDINVDPKTLKDVKNGVDFGKYKVKELSY